MQSATHLLAIGPLPPPVAGTSVSFQLFCDLLDQHPEQVTLRVINSAPRQLGQKPLLTTSHFSTAQRILRRLRQELAWADQVLVFGSNQFLASLGTICVGLARLKGKPCYLRAFGGSLDQYYETLNPLWQLLFMRALRRADGLIVQTDLLKRYFDALLPNRVHRVQGYRPLPKDYGMLNGRAQSDTLNLVFVGHIRAEKGVFVLLDALRRLDGVQCDIYGPLYPRVAQRFEEEVAAVPNARYRGVLPPEDVIPRLRDYDALIFPSFYQGEGHPGVVVEALMAGIPVITTTHRSIPELVSDGHNGLLVPPRDAVALAQAVQRLAEDASLRRRLADGSAASSRHYAAERVIPKLLQPLSIELHRSAPAAAELI